MRPHFLEPLDQNLRKLPLMIILQLVILMDYLKLYYYFSRPSRIFIIDDRIPTSLDGLVKDLYSLRNAIFEKINHFTFSFDKNQLDATRTTSDVEALSGVLSDGVVAIMGIVSKSYLFSFLF